MFNYIGLSTFYRDTSFLRNYKRKTLGIDNDFHRNKEKYYARSIIYLFKRHT